MMNDNNNFPSTTIKIPVFVNACDNRKLTQPRQAQKLILPITDNSAGVGFHAVPASAADAPGGVGGRGRHGMVVVVCMTDFCFNSVYHCLLVFVSNFKLTPQMCLMVPVQSRFLCFT